MSAIDDENPDLDLDAFLNAIRPAFPPHMCKPDVMAVLKRASVILNTKDYIYVKLAAMPEVERFNVEGSYLTEAAMRHLNAFYQNGVKRDFGGLLEREAEMAAKAFASYQTPDGRAVSSKEARAAADKESAGAALFGMGSRATGAHLRNLGLNFFKRKRDASSEVVVKHRVSPLDEEDDPDQALRAEQEGLALAWPD